MTPPLRAVVLAAGQGSRLRPLTARMAKPALPFVGTPILTRILDGLAEAGVEEAIVNLHQAPESIVEVVKQRGDTLPRVTWSDERAGLLGTGGALMAMRPQLLAAHDTGEPASDFLLVNGDCIHDLDYDALLQAHRRSGASATLAVLPRSHPEFGSLVVAEDGQVEVFGTPTTGAANQRHFLSVQALSPGLLETLPDGPARPLGTFTDWYPDAVRAGHVFQTFEAETEWHAVDTRDRYIKATAAWLATRGGGPFVGQNVDVAETATVDEHSALHASSAVAAGARLERTVLLDGARVGEDATLVDCLVGPDVQIPAGAIHEQEILAAWDDVEAAS